MRIGLVLVLCFFVLGCGGEEQCTSHDSTSCQEGINYWIDSCGNFEEVIENCDCGCTPEHSGCKSCGCEKDCTGRECGPDPVCGESCGTCPGNLVCDVGECICQTHDHCDDNSICIYESCTLAYGREYRITVVSVLVSQYDQNNEAWDALGGMPDPYICFYRNDQASAEFCTSVKDDTLIATYNESFETIIRGSDKWLMYVWDEDISDHDPIGGFVMDPITVSMIKSGGIMGQGDYALELVTSIEPVL